jgi:hypothetical protein
MDIVAWALIVMAMCCPKRANQAIGAAPSRKIGER